MTTEATAPLERKLNSLRRILWLCFAGGSVLSMALVGSASLLIIVRQGGKGVGARGFTLPLLIGLGLFGAVAFTAVACLVIYHVIKGRLEREDELFF